MGKRLMAGNSTEYIKHHLTNLTYGQHPVNGWSFAHNAKEAQEMGFWAFHVDTLAVSVVLGLFFILLFRAAAKRATARDEKEARLAGPTLRKVVTPTPADPAETTPDGEEPKRENITAEQLFANFGKNKDGGEE